MKGAIHGRFHPFHIGHLEYALRAYLRVDLLYIGITNSEPGHIQHDATAPHRHRLRNNPFEYFQRMEMALGALCEAGAAMDRLRVIPFPINRPELLRHYVPPDVIHFVSVFDEWGERKVQILSGSGFKVEAWRDMSKLTSGTEVRRLISEDRDVSDLVPKFVFNYIHNTPMSCQNHEA